MDIRLRLIPYTDSNAKYDGLVYYDNKKVVYEAVIEYKNRQLGKDVGWKTIPVVIDESESLPSNTDKWERGRSTKRVE